MGTTIVAAAVRGGVAQILSVGDSRAYRITRRGIVQITKDHSLVEDMVDRGELTRAQARNHPKKNFITRALGVDAQVRADGFTVRLRPATGIVYLFHFSLQLNLIKLPLIHYSI